VSRGKLFSRPGASLTTSAFYILLSLSVQDRHGYDILKDVTLSSAGRIKMGPGILYTTLKRMLEAGLIVEVEGRCEVDREDSRRRYYRLSREGRAELATELERMEQALKVARTRRLRSAQ
jgi:DNA-binding PadR family transcriptional regulator